MKLCCHSTSPFQLEPFQLDQSGEGTTSKLVSKVEVPDTPRMSRTLNISAVSMGKIAADRGNVKERELKLSYSVSDSGPFDLLQDHSVVHVSPFHPKSYGH